jgi:hypothetical protein
MMMKPMKPALVLGVLGVVACASPPPEYDGIGIWKVSKTTLKDATGRCEPTDLPDGRKGSFCFGQTPIKLAGAMTEIDLYFDGTEPTSKLIEEQLKVRGCREEQTLAFLRRLFGQPSDTKGAKVFWQNRYVFVVATAPSEPAQCLIRLFPLSEKSEIEKMKL